METILTLCINLIFISVTDLKTNNEKVRILKRHKRSNDNEETTLGYNGRFVRKEKVKRISDALFELREKYNLTFPDVTEPGITLIRTPVWRKRRHAAEMKKDSVEENENPRRSRGEDRKFFIDNVDTIHKQAEEFYNNLTKDTAYLEKMRREFAEEFNKVNYSDHNEVIAGMVVKNAKTTDVIDAEQLIDEQEDEKLREMLRRPITDLKHLNLDTMENMKHEDALDQMGHRVKRFYMSSDERERIRLWNLYCNITGDEKLMNELREEWKKNTTRMQHMKKREVTACMDGIENVDKDANKGKDKTLIQSSFQGFGSDKHFKNRLHRVKRHSVRNKRQKRDYHNAHMVEEKGPKFYEIRKWFWKKFLNDTGRPANYTLDSPFSSYEEPFSGPTTIKYVSKKPKPFKKTTPANGSAPLDKYKGRILKPLINHTFAKTTRKPLVNVTNQNIKHNQTRNVMSHANSPNQSFVQAGNVTGDPTTPDRTCTNTTDTQKRRRRDLDNHTNLETKRRRGKRSTTASTTLNLIKEAAIKKAKKEARKYGIWLEKMEQACNREYLEDEHFNSYPDEPFFIQKTSTPKITVFSWEATETGEHGKNNR